MKSSTGRLLPAKHYFEQQMVAREQQRRITQRAKEQAVKVKELLTFDYAAIELRTLEAVRARLAPSFAAIPWLAHSGTPLRPVSAIPLMIGWSSYLVSIVMVVN